MLALALSVTLVDNPLLLTVHARGDTRIALCVAGTNTLQANFEKSVSAGISTRTFRSSSPVTTSHPVKMFL